MTKSEFFMEAALRYISAYPTAHEWDIDLMARKLTEEVFETVEKLEKQNNGNELNPDEVPISTILDYIEGQWYGSGYCARLVRIFTFNEINTLGDLLRIGRRDFKKYRDIGRGCISRLDDALQELFDIKDW